MISKPIFFLMKNSSPFPMKSRLMLSFSLLLLALGVYFVFVQNTYNQDLPNAEKTVVEGTDQELASSSTDLVATYTKLYGKYQVKAFANHKFSMPTEGEIETLRLEVIALDQLYFKMTAEERTKIKRASFPYAQLEVDGKISYKKFEDLTPGEREKLKC